MKAESKNNVAAESAAIVRDNKPSNDEVAANAANIKAVSANEENLILLLVIPRLY